MVEPGSVADLAGQADAYAQRTREVDVAQVYERVDEPAALGRPEDVADVAAVFRLYRALRADGPGEGADLAGVERHAVVAHAVPRLVAAVVDPLGVQLPAREAHGPPGDDAQRARRAGTGRRIVHLDRVHRRARAGVAFDGLGPKTLSTNFP